MSKNKKKFDTF